VCGTEVFDDFIGLAFNAGSAPPRGAAVRGAKKRPLRSPSSAPALARGAAVCGAEIFDDFICLAFQRGIGAMRGRASQTAMPRNVGRRLFFLMAS